MSIAPGHEPPLERIFRMRVIGIVDDITLEQAQQALPRAKELFTANARGVLVDEVCCETLHLFRNFGRQSFELFLDRFDNSFSCVVRRPGHEGECFDPEGRAVNYKPIDSVLGETTLEGILRVLDIPRHMVPPPPEGAAPTSSRPPKRRREDI